MARLSIRLLGPFQVTLDGEPITGFESDKVRALLAYLVAEPDWPHRRETLAGLLWPDYPERSARANLRRALANLRKVIGDHQARPPFLHISRQTVQFNSASDAWCDVTEFTRLLDAKGPSPQTLRQLEDAMALYRGSFLEGLSVGDSAAFEEWALLKREQLQRRALAALHRLAAHYRERGEYERALPYAWRQVELEPWQEQAHRQLMRLLALNGQRGAALAQYEACRRALAEGLGVEPAAATTRLYEQIRDGEVAPPSPRPELASLAEPDTPAPPPPARPRPGRRIAGGRLALVGSSLLLLIIVAAIFFYAARGEFGGAVSPKVSTPPPISIAAQSEGGRVVDVCRGVTPPQICVLDLQTGRRIQVTDSLAFESIGGFSWSPDGQQIVFDAGSDFGLTGRHDHKLYVINADGSDLRQITSGDVNDLQPAWSPDGQWIAFHRTGALWIVQPDGSEARMLFGDPAEFSVGAIAWSPDSQQIAFGKRCMEIVRLPPEVWIINRDGTAPQEVYAFEQPLDSGTLTWSPDGQQIVCVYVYAHENEEKAFIINADGSGEPQMMDKIPWSWFLNFWPQWSEAE